MIKELQYKKKVLENPEYTARLQNHEIANVIRTVLPIFKTEKSLIDVKGSVVFIGDIHGDFQTTKAIVKQFFTYDHLVFLGDYIDREPMQWGSLLTMTYLLLLKCSFPKKFILLKGNHECHYLIPCYPYEFEDEILQRFGTSELHAGFVEVFAEMPLMVLSHRIFAAHGGILKRIDGQTLNNIDKNNTTAIKSLVWSDPALSPTYRGIGDRFDKNELLRFLEGIQANVFIRGHDYATLGYSIYDDRCLTLFSSSQFKEAGNRGILVAWTEKDIARVKDLCVEDFSSGQWKTYKVIKI